MFEEFSHNVFCFWLKIEIVIKDHRYDLLGAFNMRELKSMNNLFSFCKTLQPFSGISKF